MLQFDVLYAFLDNKILLFYGGTGKLNAKNS